MDDRQEEIAVIVGFCFRFALISSQKQFQRWSVLREKKRLQSREDGGKTQELRVAGVVLHCKRLDELLVFIMTK